MNIRWRVELSQDEREELTALLKSGRHAVRKVKRAQILLAADDGSVTARSRLAWEPAARRSIAPRRFVEGNLEPPWSRPRAPRSAQAERQGGGLLIATACSAPPAGRARWTLELLADVMVALTEHEGLSRETVRRRLAENALKPLAPGHVVRSQGRRRLCAAMEDVLDLYGGPDPTRPVICFDESPTQLSAKCGRRFRPAPHGRWSASTSSTSATAPSISSSSSTSIAPWRRSRSPSDRAAATSRNACASSATDVAFPRSRKEPGSSWTTSTHSPASLSTPCPHPRPASSAAWSFTPKHAAGSTWWRSSLGVLRGQCLDRRISSRATPRSRDRRLGRQRNDSAARIKWVHDGESQTQTESRISEAAHLDRRSAQTS